MHEWMYWNVINLISDVLHGPLWLAVLSIIALLMFAVAGLIFSFFITSVLKEYWQNEKSKQRKAERLKNIATENWPSKVQQHIEQHLSIVQKKKKKSMILNIVWLITIIGTSKN